MISRKCVSKEKSNMAVNMSEKMLTVYNSVKRNWEMDYI